MVAIFYQAIRGKKTYIIFAQTSNQLHPRSQGKPTFTRISIFLNMSDRFNEENEPHSASLLGAEAGTPKGLTLGDQHPC
jgi:hypothetical protein